MGGLLKIEGWNMNGVCGSYIIECLNISEMGAQWGRLSS